jgi:hypothetical protein
MQDLFTATGLSCRPFISVAKASDPGIAKAVLVNHSLKR